MLTANGSCVTSATNLRTSHGSCRLTDPLAVTGMILRGREESTRVQMSLRITRSHRLGERKRDLDADVLHQYIANTQNIVRLKLDAPS